MNQSIHPRVKNGRTIYDKVNTAKAPDRSRILKVAMSMKEHIDQHPRDKASIDHFNKLKY